MAGDMEQLELSFPEPEKKGKLIDLSYELRVRQLSQELVADLGLGAEEVEQWGGGLNFANQILDMFDDLPVFEKTSLEEDHQELFNLLRGRAGR